MHTMQDEESQNMAQEESSTSNGYLDSRQTRKGKDSKSPKLVLAAVGGMLLPLLTQLGHAH